MFYVISFIICKYRVNSWVWNLYNNNDNNNKKLVRERQFCERQTQLRRSTVISRDRKEWSRYACVLCFKGMSNEESTSGSIKSAKQREVCSRASRRIGTRVGKRVSLFILVADNRCIL